jgi:tetratricopeptide (TPR) repeat protein
MRRLVRSLFVLPLVLALPGLAGAQTAATVEETGLPGSPRVNPASHQKLFGAIPLSTSSADARRFVELAMDKYENVLLNDSTVLAQHATEKDRQFALGYAMLSFAARRGTPDPQALARAKQLLPQASPDERLLVRWMTGVQESDFLPAISSMNDLISRYPNDPHILYLIAEWLYFQQDYDRSRRMFEKIITLDPNFPPALNMLGYAYIETGSPDPQKAIACLEHYARLQPGSPNPEDSLGEVLRLAGHDEESIQHYAAALQIDPTFITSRVGIGDTLTLMGKYEQARIEYDKAAGIATNPRDLLHAKYQKALVYFWEGRPAQGLRSLEILAAEAEKQKEPYSQFEAGFALALLARQDLEKLQQLTLLQSRFSEPQLGMNESDRNESLATILREQVRLLASENRPAEAQSVIAKLEQLAATTRDLIVENSYESARGYLLFSQGNLRDAVDELSTDPNSPIVLQQLALAQDKLGEAAAASTKARLKYLRASTVEWFLVTHPSAS